MNILFDRLKSDIIPFPIKMDIVDACENMQIAGYAVLFYNALFVVRLSL